MVASEDICECACGWLERPELVAVTPESGRGVVLGDGRSSGADSGVGTVVVVDVPNVPNDKDDM
jgi:hypothetical protein